jgi:hypothetical protein
VCRHYPPLAERALGSGESVVAFLGFITEPNFPAAPDPRGGFSLERFLDSPRRREGALGGLAEFERHLILARTSEGRQRAQQRGVRFGRKRKLTLHQQQEALVRRAVGEALVDIARTYNVSHSTISMLATALTLRATVQI